jgi:hypothetical protein
MFIETMLIKTIYRERVFFMKPLSFYPSEKALIRMLLIEHKKELIKMLNATYNKDIKGIIESDINKALSLLKKLEN